MGSILVPNWLHFGRILEPCSPQEPLKGLSKNIQIFHSFGSPSFIDFPRFLAGFWRILDPSWPPKSMKKWIKMLTKFLLEFWSVWVRFLLNFASKLEGRENQKLWKTLWGFLILFAISANLPTRNYMKDFLVNLAFNLRPKIRQKSTYADSCCYINLSWVL